jgi:hypothetical protein
MDEISKLLADPNKLVGGGGPSRLVVTNRLFEDLFRMSTFLSHLYPIHILKSINLFPRKFPHNRIQILCRRILNPDAALRYKRNVFRL